MHYGETWMRTGGQGETQPGDPCPPAGFRRRTRPPNEAPASMKKVCEFCSGSGQISYFKGVSRFLLSTEECPECAGLGYIFTAPDDADNLKADIENPCPRPDKNRDE